MYIIVYRQRVFMAVLGKLKNLTTGTDEALTGRELQSCREEMLNHRKTIGKP